MLAVLIHHTGNSNMKTSLNYCFVELKEEKMIKSKKRRASKMVALFLVLFLAVGTISVSAESLGDVNNEIEDKENELAQGEAQLSDLAEEINALNAEIKAAQEDIAELKSEITTAQKKVDEATAALEKKQEELDYNRGELNVRLRNMYKSGSMGFVDVLLSSESITDLFINYDMVQMIYDNDQELVDQLEEDYKQIEEEVGNLEDAKANLEAKETDMIAKEESLTVAQEELAAERSKISAEQLETEKAIQELEKEADRLTAELAGQGSDEDYAGGYMAWPTVSRTITSYYGSRPDPFGSGTTGFHSGIDISASYGTPIYAANAGTVYTAGWNYSYGYYIIIDHGGGIMTLYAHNQSLYVSAGQSVSRGQTIAGAGSTGQSTGPHLHFEVRINGVRTNPLGYL